jgi:uncharacterized protein with GYD domain
MKNWIKRNWVKTLNVIGIIVIVSSIILLAKANYLEQQQAEQSKMEMEAGKEFLIDVVGALSELDIFREKVISKGKNITTEEIGKMLEISAHRDYLAINRYSSSEYKNIRELSTQISDVFSQLEDYGVKMNADSDKNFNDFSIVINELPDNIRVTLDYLYDGKIELTETGKSEVLFDINRYFKDELERYEKYLITKSTKDFTDMFSEDLTAIFMNDILTYGHVRLADLGKRD